MTLEDVCKLMAGPYGVTVSDIKGPRGTRDTIRARLAYYYYARRMTTKTWGQIGRHVNRIDHATALLGARSFEQRIRGRR